MLCAVGAGGELVGVSRFCDYPDYVKSLPRLSEFDKADVDAIAKVRPDLVVSSTRIQDKIVEGLVRRNVRVFVLQPTDLGSVFDNMRFLGQLVDHKEESRELVLSVKAGLAAIRERSGELPRRPVAMVEEWGEPIMVAVPWVAELLTIAGGSNAWEDFIAEADPEPRTVTAEDVIARDPEMDFLAWCGLYGRVDPAQVAKRPGWAESRLVRHGGLIPIDDRFLMRAGPRIVEGAARMQATIFDWVEEHPEPPA